MSFGKTRIEYITRAFLVTSIIYNLKKTGGVNEAKLITERADWLTVESIERKGSSTTYTGTHVYIYNHCIL